jgi:hypothetical protein
VSTTSGSLALARSILFTGTHAKTASIRAFDLDGRPLPLGFSFRDPVVGRSEVAGLMVDEDHALWVADAPAGCVRRFSLFGREIGRSNGDEGGPPSGAPPLRPVDVDLHLGHVVVAGAEESAHAVRLFDRDFSHRTRLASLGAPGRVFARVTRVASFDRHLFVSESLARRVQVFRDLEFLFAFRIDESSGGHFVPCAVAGLDGGRAVIACREPSAVLVLVDASGGVVRVLAHGGEGEDALRDPVDVVVEPGEEERRTRVFVSDQDGLRVLVLTLEGRVLGSFSTDGKLPGQPARRRNRP